MTLQVSLCSAERCSQRRRWFHGKITREQAERLLYPPETGLFLVRESTNYPGDYTLCVSCDGKVEHYRIIYHNGKLTIDEEEYFENLISLCHHFATPRGQQQQPTSLPNKTHHTPNRSQNEGIFIDR
uniref:SH2 domain-containing protein n=1 Tax=Labrus bergylta TaxID=56723 RepID=A0A3Q3H3Q7_9LABR